MSGWVQQVRLSTEQRSMIEGTLSDMKRSPALRDPKVQERIIQRIEGALIKLSQPDQGPVPAVSADRLQRLANGKPVALHEYEQDLLDLLATAGGKSCEELAQTAAESLKLGRGKKYGELEENKTRFLADQLAALFEIELDQRASYGENSNLRNLLDVVCGQVGLPILSRDAVQSITTKYR